MYVKIVLTLLVVLTAVLAVGVSRPRIVVEAAIPAPPGRADAALDRQVNSLPVSETTVEAAVKVLETLGEVKLDVNWDALANAGVRRTDRIQAHVNAGTFGSAIQSVLASGHPGLVLVCDADGDVVTVSTASAFVKDLEVRTYDVRDLLTDRYWGIKVAPADIDEIQGSRIASLAGTIEECVGEGSWDRHNFTQVSYGGSWAEFQWWAGRLIVTQTARNHRKIERMLATLRQMQ
jgi:hypothetical protein